MMLQENAKVMWNQKVGPGYYRLGLGCNEGYARTIPGQFVMLRLVDQTFPLLSRPFSVHRLIVSQGRIKGLEILYKVIGRCTQRFSRLVQNDSLQLLGPLGRGFEIVDAARIYYLAAGGVGVAPMVFLASCLKTQGVDMSGCTLFLGARTEADLLCRDDFRALGVRIQVTTEDGSTGERGLVTHSLKAAVASKRPDMLLACGPVEMLAHVGRMAHKYAVPCQVSIETMMACGMGACLGCAIEAKDSPSKYLHACLDGPVFAAQHLKLDLMVKKSI